MKIGVWINKDISPYVGGGFSYTSKLIELIDQKEFTKELEVCFVSFEPLNFPSNKESIVLTRKLNEGLYLQNLFTSIIQKFYVFRNITNRINSKKNERINNAIYKQLTKATVDIIYYVGQMEQNIPNFPFIATNWDLGHLTLPPFPEVSSAFQLDKRRKWYNHTIKNAKAIFAESEAGKAELIKYLNIESNKIDVLPMFPGNIIDLDVSPGDQITILNQFELKKDSYFFYPAQFWEHKNHQNLIIGFSSFLKKFPHVSLVFSGSDKGCLEEVLEEARNLEIIDQINYLGFISNEALFSLYKNTIALVMPTLLGPTNMPPLEARALDCPVLCSDFEGHREQLGEGAIYFDPNDADSIENALIQIMNPESRFRLLESATLEKDKSKFKSDESIKILENLFLNLNPKFNVLEKKF